MDEWESQNVPSNFSTHFNQASPRASYLTSCICASCLQLPLKFLNAKENISFGDNNFIPLGMLLQTISFPGISKTRDRLCAGHCKGIKLLDLQLKSYSLWVACCSYPPWNQTMLGRLDYDIFVTLSKISNSFGSSFLAVVFRIYCCEIQTLSSTPDKGLLKFR